MNPNGKPDRTMSRPDHADPASEMFYPGNPKLCPTMKTRGNQAKTVERRINKCNERTFVKFDEGFHVFHDVFVNLVDIPFDIDFFVQRKR